jgi:hypothetical protein
MRRSDLEHIIRASSAVAEDNEIVAVGSQAILGQFPNAPSELLRSIELDVFPKNKPERSDVIDGAIGEQSVFHQTFGYYAHGVSPETAVLPRGWESRLIAVQNENTRGATGWCVEVHDLAVSKLVAGREKDREFLIALVKHRMVDSAVIHERLDSIPLEPRRSEEIRQRFKRWLSESKRD